MVPFAILLSIGVLTAALIASRPAEPITEIQPRKLQAAELRIFPSELSLRGPDLEHGVLVTAVWPDGRTEDVTGSAAYSSRTPHQAQWSGPGRVRAVANGTGILEVEFAGKRATLNVAAQDCAKKLTPSFKQDVLPVLTRAGCNMGSCHGKMAGQNGFKLSLRGYAPEWDYEWVVQELGGRRINVAFPEDSLILNKAVGVAPHEGGARFARDSREFGTLREWVAARAPGPVKGEADSTKLEVLPGNRTLRVGDAQQLLARAHYADGRVRDVTWMAQFFSNDENTAKVTPQGLVSAVRHGETSVRVHFQGHVQVVMISIPYENKIETPVLAANSNPVDTHVFAKLEQLKIPASPLCDDASYIRRATLDATGVLPSPDEVRAFLADTSPDKRAKLVETLLQRSDFTDYWTLQFCDILQNRRERDHDVRGAKNVRAFHAWLREQIAANRPWDELARDILTAEGNSVEKPQIGYFIYTIGEKRNVEDSEVADSVAQAFLGTRIGCAKCHNHPLERYTQDDYYHFAAFFSRTVLRRSAPTTKPTELVNATWDEEEKRKRVAEAEKKITEAQAAVEAAKAKSPEEQKKAADQLTGAQKQLADAKKQLEQPKGAAGVTQPRTRQRLAPKPLDRSDVALTPGEDPRVKLAEWITNPKNEYFSGAMVNRVWKHYMGTGLVENVDDLRTSNPPSNPELWKALNEEFVTKKFDLRSLMRTIMNSRAYQLSSATLPGNESDKRFYSHYYARRLPAEVMLDAIATATGVPDTFAGYPLGVRATQLPEPAISSYFLSLFGRSDRVTACACERSGEVTLPQLLHLQNGQDLLGKIKNPEGRLADLLKQANADVNRLIDDVFLSTVARLPEQKERTAVASLLSEADAKKDEVLSDLFWALMNSKEFSFNH